MLWIQSESEVKNGLKSWCISLIIVDYSNENANINLASMKGDLKKWHIPHMNSRIIIAKFHFTNALSRQLKEAVGYILCALWCYKYTAFYSNIAITQRIC